MLQVPIRTLLFSHEEVVGKRVTDRIAGTRVLTVDGIRGRMVAASLCAALVRHLLLESSAPHVHLLHHRAKVVKHETRINYIRQDVGGKVNGPVQYAPATL